MWGWTPFVDPDPMLSYFTCDQVTTDPDDPTTTTTTRTGATRSTTQLYEQQKVELDPERRAARSSTRCCACFYDEATYVVLFLRAPTCRPTAPTASRAGCGSPPRSGRCCSPTRRRRTRTSSSCPRPSPRRPPRAAEDDGGIEHGALVALGVGRADRGAVACLAAQAAAHRGRARVDAATRAARREPPLRRRQGSRRRSRRSRSSSSSTSSSSGSSRATRSRTCTAAAT